MQRLPDYTKNQIVLIPELFNLILHGFQKPSAFILITVNSCNNFIVITNQEKKIKPCKKEIDSKICRVKYIGLYQKLIKPALWKVFYNFKKPPGIFFHSPNLTNPNHSLSKSKPNNKLNKERKITGRLSNN